MTKQCIFGSKRTSNIVSFEGKLQLAEKGKYCELQYDAELESLKGMYHCDAKRKTSYTRYTQARICKESSTRVFLKHDGRQVG